MYTGCVRVLVDVTNGRVKDDLVAALQRAGHTVERGSAAVSHRRFDVIVVGSVEMAERLHRERPTGGQPAALFFFGSSFLL